MAPGALLLKQFLFVVYDVTNLVSTVQVTVNRPVITSVTGGVLGCGVYYLQDAVIYWSGDYRSDAATLIDGVG